MESLLDYLKIAHEEALPILQKEKLTPERLLLMADEDWKILALPLGVKLPLRSYVQELKSKIN